MLTNDRFDPGHAVSRKTARKREVTKLDESHTAANASNWSKDASQRRRLHRQRRQHQATPLRVSGWSVRTW